MIPPVGAAVTYNTTVTFKTPTGSSLTIPLLGGEQGRREQFADPHHGTGHYQRRWWPGYRC